MFASEVTMMSKPFCSARSSRRPFEMPAQPISGAVRTSWLVSSRAIPAGTDSSSNIRFGIPLPGKGYDAPRRFERERWIDFLDDLLGGIAVIGVVDHGLSRDPRAAHDRCTGHHVRLGLD